MGTAFGSSSMLCGLACLLCFLLDPVASQSLCEAPNLVVISGTGPVLVPSLQPSLCFGCFFFNSQGFSSFVPLGTVWSVTVSGITTQLTNDTELVTLSGTNGTILFDSPSSLLQFETSQLRCFYSSPSNGDFSFIATLTDAALNPPFILGVNVAGESFGIEGETITLNCSNDDNPNLNEEFTWLDSKGVALDSSGIVRPHNLILPNVTRDQSGVYVCVVSFEEASLTVNTTLIVQYPALILSGPSASPSSTVHTGSNLILTCTFEGVPAPNVTWTVNGSDVDVDGNERLSVMTNDGSTQLMFTPVMGWDNGQYVCIVDNGIGSLSVSTAIDVTVQVPPEPVTGLTVVNFTNVSVTLEWVLGFNGNAELTQVTVSYITVANFANLVYDMEILQPTETMKTLSGLEPHTQYNFTVLAVNAVGSSQPATVQVSTLPNTPGAPTSVNVEAASSTSLLVTWTKPSFNSSLQTPFMTYKIEYSVDTTVQVDTIPYMDSVESHTITNLMKGTYYSVRVALNNSAGEGDYSSPKMGRTAVDPPMAVTNPLVTSYPTSLCASWGPPEEDGGSPIVSYHLELRNSTDATEQNVTIGAATRFHSFEYLVANTSYTVIIAASNAEADPGVPTELTKSTSNDFDVLMSFTLSVPYTSAISINVSWDPQESVNEYRVQYRQPATGDVTWTQTSSCDCTSYLISGLEPETEYEIRAILVGSNNCTRLSTPIMTATTREVVVVVEPSVEGVVTSGQPLSLTCRLDSGEDAPSVMWNRTDGSPLPSDAVFSDSNNVLTIPSPVPTDSGDYVCFSRDANFTFSLQVEDPPTVSPTSSTEPAPEGLDITIVIIIAVLAAISMLVFFLVLIIAIFVCCRNKSRTAQKYPMKKKEKIWMDEGAGGFIPSTMNPNNTYRNTTNDDEIDAPIETGRRMTTDPQYTAATSFMNNQNPEKDGLKYADVEHQQHENSSYPNKENRVEYMTVGSSTFHGSRELILSSTTTDV